MKICLIDTETSGLFDYTKPADGEGQPRLASLAMILLEEDLTTGMEMHFFVAPEGWEMQEEAARVNGLTTAFLKEKGLPVKHVLDQYAGAIDEGYVIASHNVSYDLKVMRGELRRAKMEDRYEKTLSICTMHACTQICRIPSKRGYKFPKLSEACAHFGVELQGEHSALGDARAAVHILRHLSKLNALKVNQPKVAAEA